MAAPWQQTPSEQLPGPSHWTSHDPLEHVTLSKHVPLPEQCTDDDDPPTVTDCWHAAEPVQSTTMS